ncbi:MAG: exo-beta-N-acetylmuramidase NamZ family protein, partial [Armatimonadota bacterium]
YSIPVWILDRPNPITGLRPEGPVLNPNFTSFVGMYPIAQRHGLTMGELAKLFQKRFGVQCELTVVELDGWSRDMWFDETGLPWVLPSPNMPTLDTAIVYPGTCILEGTNVSEGRGTTKPFELIGAPWISPFKLKEQLLEYKLPGVVFREAYFTPYTSKFQGIRCAGLQIHVLERNKFQPVVTGVALVVAIRKLYPNNFSFREPNVDGNYHFDLLCGTSAVRDAIEKGKSPWEIAKMWESDMRKYVELCEDVYLY